MKTLEMMVKKNTLYTSLDPNFTHTGLVVEINKNMNGLDKSYVFFGESDKRFLKVDVHNEENENQQQSELIISNKPSKIFSFFSGELEGKVIFKLIFAKPLKNSQIFNKKKSPINCEIPDFIDQDIWRVGLPSPTILPTSHQVFHIILHHSAGSNSDTDYINTVRNIYLYHTQILAWDDVGYNYLVAPNGQVFAGRDGLGVDDDNIKGAHLCAKNTNTMGICMLGNYQTAIPTDTAVQSIIQLLAWKLQKENLNPKDSSLHPINNPNSNYLGTVAGHKDGCATNCPGNNFYIILDSIKNVVVQKLASCSTTGFANNYYSNGIILSPNPTNDLFTISSDNLINRLEVINLLGQIKFVSNPNSTQINFSFNENNLGKGIYFIKVYNEQKSSSFKLIFQ